MTLKSDQRSTRSQGSGRVQPNDTVMARTSNLILPSGQGSLSSTQEMNTLEGFSLSSAHQAAVDRCLETLCELLHFEIAEMWTYVGGLGPEDGKASQPKCLQVFVKKATVVSYMEILGSVLTVENNNARHHLSPNMVQQARMAEDILWFTSEHPNTPLHPDLPLNTAVALPISLDAHLKDLCFVFFAVNDVHRYDTAVGVLEQLCRAAGYAAATAFPAFNKKEEDAIIETFSQMTLSNSIKSKAVKDGGEEKETEEVKGAVTRPKDGSFLVREDVRWDELSDVEFMVNGSRCTIYTAFLETIPVVVKLVRKDVEDKDIVKKELELEMSILMRLQHPNIVRIIGAGSRPEHFILLERLDGGTLAQQCGNALAIRDRRRRFRHKRPFGYEELLKRGMQLAEALQYMHNDAIPGKMVVHRDLKPDNVGFDASGNLKLIDMGLSKVISKKEDDKAVYMMTGETGSLRYMAPEVAMGKPYNGSADVYGFSMILWEMATMTKPFEALARDGFIQDVVIGGFRPRISKNWPPEFGRLLTDCWSSDMHKRLNFKQIIATLQGMLEDAAKNAEQARHVTKYPRKKFGGLFQSGSKKASDWPSASPSARGP
ncbi:unnamed protein product [Choristocarpus tenellus]